jgi:polysaccharide deacetylase family protein (PEP-CTERM system associated)
MLFQPKYNGKNVLGIDFEEWFHPQLVQNHIPKKDHELKICQGIDKIIEWLRKKETHATFFMVGELLEKKPELLDKIIENDHDIAFHTMKHNRLDDKNFKEEFKEELDKFDKLTSGRSRGFRAPTFSLNKNSAWVIDYLIEKNYLYDSSIVPAQTKLYGFSNAEISPYRISSENLLKDNKNSSLIEFPLLVSKILGKKIPSGGGFFLRFLPLKIIEKGIRTYEKLQIPSTFYIHSWELTPEFMPSLPLPVLDKFVTYYNLSNAMPKMGKLLEKFEFTSFERYIKSG